MGLLQGSYTTKVSWQIKTALVFVGLLILLVLAFFLMGVLGIPLLANPTAQGAQGDFIGGHLAAIIGSLTLIVVILTAYLQSREDRKFRIREYFLSGISAISSYEAQQPATEQALRLLDYYALVALDLQDNELLLILNTVITRDIRKRIEDIEKSGGREYPNAAAARKEIQRILEDYYRKKSRNKA